MPVKPEGKGKKKKGGAAEHDTCPTAHSPLGRGNSKRANQTPNQTVSLSEAELKFFNDMNWQVLQAMTVTTHEQISSKKAASDVADIMIACFEGLHSAVERKSPEVSAWCKKLWLVPAYLLHLKEEERNESDSIRDRITLWRERNFAELQGRLTRSMNSALPDAEQTDALVVRRAERDVGRGRLSRAFQTLTSPTKRVKANDEQMAAVRFLLNNPSALKTQQDFAKTRGAREGVGEREKARGTLESDGEEDGGAAPAPAAATGTTNESDEPAFILTRDLLEKTIRDAKSGTAPGKSGLRAEHLKKLLNVNSYLSQCLQRFAALYLGGRLPSEFVRLLAGGKAVLVLPEGATKLRPIVLQETLYRIVHSAVAKQLHAKVDAQLMPLQMALHTNSVCALPLATHYVLRERRDWVCVALDMSAAYCSVARPAVVAGLREAGLSELVPIFLATYGQALPARVQREEGGCEAVEVEVGVFQGDPMAGIYFSVALLTAMKKAQAVLTASGGVVRGYLDDLFPLGTVEGVANAVCVLRDEASKVGLRFNAEKTRILGMSAEICERARQAIEGMAEAQCVDLSREMTLILGVPIGCEEAIKKYLEGRQAVEGKAINRIRLLECMQSASLLLRYCAGPRMNHLLRTVVPETMRSHAEWFDQVILGVCQHIHGEFQLDVDAKVQVRLQVSRGGMGLSSALDHSPAAFLGAHADVLHDLHVSFPSLQAPINAYLSAPLSTHGAAIISALAVVRGVVTLTKQDPGPLKAPKSLEELKMMRAKPQRTLSDLIHTLGEKAYDNASTRKRTNLLSLQQLGAAAVLTALPSKPALRMKPRSFQLMLARRNMLPTRLINANYACVCGAYNYRSTEEGDILLQDDYHLETCSKTGGPIHRHNAVRDALVYLLRERGAGVAVEPIIGPEDGQRGDILIHCLKDDKGHSYMVDVSVANVGAASITNPTKALAAAKSREFSKHRDYDVLCTERHYALIPFVLENTAALGDEARKLIKRIANLESRGPSDSLSIGQHLALALQRANADALIELAASVNSRSG